VPSSSLLCRNKRRTATRTQRLEWAVSTRTRKRVWAGRGQECTTLDVYFRLMLSIEQHLRLSEGLSCASTTGAGWRSCTRSRSVKEGDFKDDFKRHRLLGSDCGGRGKLRLIQCVPRTVRNGAHLRRSSLDKVCRDNPPLECSVCSHELPSLLRSSRLWRRSSDNKAESCSERAGISSMVLNGNIDLGAVPVLTTAINSRSLFPICWDSFDKWEVFNPLSNT